MMNREQFLLVQLSEEASEISQAACKCIRFTTSNVAPGYDKSNVDHLLTEFNQLLAVMLTLENEGVLPFGSTKPNPEIINAKLKAMSNYDSISKELGVYAEATVGRYTR